MAWLRVAEFTGCPGLQLVSTGMPRKPAEEQMVAGLLCALSSTEHNTNWDQEKPLHLLPCNIYRSHV